MPDAEQDRKDGRTRVRTIPENLQVSVQGFQPELANTLAHRLVAELAYISTRIDLSCLDGVTIACDYENSLRELDRGYETQHALSPSRDWAYGVAMTPGVLRSGEYRSHIVISAPLVTPLVDDLVKLEQGFTIEETLHTLAHEAAHVEVSAVFDAAFPEFLLRRQHTDWFVATQWEVILACWNEYAVCRIVGAYGADPLPGYIDTFLQALECAEKDANGAIIDYRSESKLNETIDIVCAKYGWLMRYYAYMIGAMASEGKAIADYPNVQEAISGSYYEETAKVLERALDHIYVEYGAWERRDIFLEIGVEFEAFLGRQGMVIERLEGDEIYVRFPFLPQTMPSLAESMARGNGFAHLAALFG